MPGIIDISSFDPSFAATLLQAETLQTSLEQFATYPYQQNLEDTTAADLATQLKEEITAAQNGEISHAALQELLYTVLKKQVIVAQARILAHSGHRFAEHATISLNLSQSKKGQQRVNTSGSPDADFQTATTSSDAKKSLNVLAWMAIQALSGDRAYSQKFHEIASGTSPAAGPAQAMLSIWDRLETLVAAEDPLTLAKRVIPLIRESEERLIQGLQNGENRDLFFKQLKDFVSIFLEVVNRLYILKNKNPDNKSALLFHDYINGPLSRVASFIINRGEGPFSVFFTRDLPLLTVTKDRSELAGIVQTVLRDNFFGLVGVAMNLEVAVPDGISLPEPHERKILKDILRELIANASIYSDQSKPKRKLTIRYAPETRTLTLADNGLGIKDVNAVWEGVREHPEIKGKPAGEKSMGLGLVRERVESIGGRIDLQSTVGVGSTFTIKLPLEIKLPFGPEVLGDEGKLDWGEEVFAGLHETCRQTVAAIRKLDSIDRAGLEKLAEVFDAQIEEFDAILKKLSEEPTGEFVKKLITELYESGMQPASNLKMWMGNSIRRMVKLGGERPPLDTLPSIDAKEVTVQEREVIVKAYVRELMERLVQWLGAHAASAIRWEGPYLVFEFSQAPRESAPLDPVVFKTLTEAAWPPDPNAFGLKIYQRLLGLTLAVATTPDDHFTVKLGPFNFK